MKKFVTFVLCLALLAALAACGAAPAQEPDPAPQDTEAIVARIREMQGQDVQDLIDWLGEPLSRDYASSCLVLGGQDGELVYEGFTVYTLVDVDGSETIYDVE